MDDDINKNSLSTDRALPSRQPWLGLAHGAAYSNREGIEFVNDN